MHFFKILLFTTILIQSITAQTNKPNYEIDTFLDVNIYKMSYEDLRRNIKNNRFPKKPSNGWYQLKNNSKKFPLTSKASLRVNGTELFHLILEFKPETFTPKEFVSLRSQIAKTILKHFPCKFTTEKRMDGSYLSRGISSKGLHIHMEYFCPNSVNYHYLSYLKVKFSNASDRITHEYNDISVKDAHLRAFANYMEATAYSPLKANEQFALTSKITQLRQKNHLLPNPGKTFYTNIANNDPYHLEFGERQQPIITNFAGLQKPNTAAYHKWTIANGEINHIDLVQKIDGREITTPLLKIWFEQGSFVLTQQTLDNKGLSKFIVTDYRSGSQARQLTLLENNNKYKTIFSTYYYNACSYTFNEFGRLTAGILLIQHKKFRYTDENRFKEASFKSADDYIYTYYYSPDYKLQRKLKLSRLFSKHTLSNYWGLTYYQIPNQYTVMKGIPEYVHNNKWCLSYRNNNENKPNPKPHNINRIEPVRQVTQKRPTTPTPSAPTPRTNTERVTFSGQIGYLDDFIKNAGNKDIFSISKTGFEKKYQANFRANWTDKFKRSARSTTPLSFSKVKSGETIFSFRKDNLSKLTMMIFNKGDDDGLHKNSFMALKEAVIGAVQGITGQKPNYKPNAGIAKNHLNWWLTEKYLIKLEYNFQETRNNFSGEYIRLSFSPFIKGMTAVNIDQLSTNVLSNQELLGLISKDKNGAVYLGGVPMVDQGKKGYCACATTARILNYYGREIDQHDIAQLALSSAQGTDPAQLQKALNNISSKLRLNITTVVKCYLGSERDIKRFIKKLESAYKRQGLRLDTNRLKPEELKPVFQEMARSDARYRDFKKGIIRSISLGRPLAWALYLGIVPEPEIPQARGGHMRLIIGYNENTEEIYYSDSWGAGHEMKTMSMQSAFWVSAALWEIRPR